VIAVDECRRVNFRNSGAIAFDFYGSFGAFGVFATFGSVGSSSSFGTFGFFGTLNSFGTFGSFDTFGSSGNFGACALSPITRSLRFRSDQRPSAALPRPLRCSVESR